jgi:5-methylcytosine-specific restriction endonuclease McrA
MTASKHGNSPAIRYRPVFGGVFGRSGEYVMATMPCIERGLDSVRYMVLHPKTGGVLAVANDKTEVLSQARRVLKAAATLTCANDDSFVQGCLWTNEQLPPPTPGAKPQGKPTSRRRRDVFERSQGRCHYCHTPLMLDGKWHVEHMLPKALGGPDDPWNLVAACVTCNLTKSDQTALEYVTSRRPAKG